MHPKTLHVEHVSPGPAGMFHPLVASQRWVPVATKSSRWDWGHDCRLLIILGILGYLGSGVTQNTSLYHIFVIYV